MPDWTDSSLDTPHDRETAGVLAISTAWGNFWRIVHQRAQDVAN